MTAHVSKTDALANIIDNVDGEVTAPRSALKLDLANLVVALDELNNWSLPAGSPVTGLVKPLI